MMYRVPYHKGYLEFDLPPGMRGTMAVSRPAEPLSDLAGAVQEALSHPVHSPRLRDLARKTDRACVAFTDITRACPDHQLLPGILAELEAAGVPDDRIILVCATGLHRPSTPEEKLVKLGGEVVKRYRILDHEARDPDALVDLGTTPGGAPLFVNKIACQADLLIATGIVEPHQYAGYSGGRKTVAIGLAGEETIAYTHGPMMVESPGVRLGNMEGNLFHEVVTEAARRAGLRFIVNVIQDEDERVVAVRAGEPEAAFLELVKIARRIYEVPIPHPYDVAVAGVGFPKDMNLYQASRAASYLFFAPESVVKEGGVIILPAATPEGPGQGVGEQRFFETLRGAKDMPSLLTELRQKGYPPGAQRAFVMAKVLEKNHVVVVDSRTPEVVSQLHMIPVSGMAGAFRIAAEKMGRDDLDVLIVPHAMLTLPVPQYPRQKDRA